MQPTSGAEIFDGADFLEWWHHQVLGTVNALRPLPWRQTRQAWPVLVSEVMLQQTQARRVVGPWRVFVDRFGDPRQCADAPASEVVRFWAGLGYNRRAIQLHRAATQMAAEHGGRVPATLPSLLALPGIGPYTARAVLAFAYEQDVAVVDTNVRRVVSRCISGGPLAPAALQRLADTLVPAGQAWGYNQALVELGALVCTGRVPRCGLCPLAKRCRWHRAGRVPPDPAAPGASQGRFAGSDRQGRGLLVAALRAGPVSAVALASAMGWPDDPGRASRVAAGVVADGLAVADADGALRLPGRSLPSRCSKRGDRCSGQEA